MSKYLGNVSAYAYAVSKGYTGTEEEFAELMASYATVGQTAVTAAQTATTKASEAASSAQTATGKATLATNKAQAASESATLATAKASAAATSETNAASSAQTASAKASEAAASATSAQEYDESAQASADNAQVAQELAGQARTGAETAQRLAEDARDEAQDIVDGINAKSEQIDANTADILKAFPTDTASGAVASFTDGANGIPLKSLVVNIDPVQSGSGDPSPDNVRPISGWTGMQIQHTGKNLVEGTIPNASITSGGGFVGSNDYEMHWGKIRKGVTYTVTTNDGSGFVGGFFTNVPVAGSVSYDGMRVITASKSFTAPITGYVAFRSATGYTTAQLEVGTTATDYEPYNGTTIPISWQTEAGTVYGGSLDVLGGNMVISMVKSALPQDRVYQPSDNRVIYLQSKFADVSKISGVVVSNAFKYCPNTPTPPLWNVSLYSNGNIIFGIDSSVITTDTEWGTFVSENDVYVVYELATPITIQLTPHEVKSLLGVNNIFADTGDCSVEYRADTKLYIERLTEPDADMIADSNIVSGQYFMVGNSLYLATANIASGGQVIVGTNAIRKSLSEALNEINQ